MVTEVRLPAGAVVWCAWLVALVLTLAGCVIRRKRRVEGAYRPSAEERKQSSAHGAEKPRLGLPLPKTERLI